MKDDKEMTSFSTFRSCSRINGGELRGQPANPGSPGKMAIKTECVSACV